MHCLIHKILRMEKFLKIKTSFLCSLAQISNDKNENAQPSSGVSDSKRLQALIKPVVMLEAPFGTEYRCVCIEVERTIIFGFGVLEAVLSIAADSSLNPSAVEFQPETSSSQSEQTTTNTEAESKMEADDSTTSQPAEQSSSEQTQRSQPSQLSAESQPALDPVPTPAQTQQEQPSSSLEQGN